VTRGVQADWKGNQSLSLEWSVVCVAQGKMVENDMGFLIWCCHSALSRFKLADQPTDRGNLYQLSTIFTDTQGE